MSGSGTTRGNDPNNIARRPTESDIKRREIIAEVAHTADPEDDIDYRTKRELYKAGRISTSELHETGSSELLPRGWYEYYVEGLEEYCPARVFSLDEAGADAAALYERGFRWMVVFSEATGPRGDRTFIDVRSFGAAAMTESGMCDEEDALRELALMGMRIDALPKDVFMTSPPQPVTPLPPQGWYPDPTQRFEHRWWDGQRWTPTVAITSQTYSDPI